ncbi:hypothetical protein IB277_31865 [Ensifer sp. ENS07]|uniref:hypothetical protein n=1 Tax=Ensifer sp. ENS07 TaxID=2769274 RepID=UPI0017843C21|nr:hypothetical protein [Ensifer sp. ENS07]MBD9640899.1 hypothetical protein [Ensifer sp. ENS07]
MRILEKIGQVTRGEIDVGGLPGSTTERMTIGLALDALEKTNPGFAGDQKGAWQRLDASQRRIVRDFNLEYRKEKWLTEDDVAMAVIDDCAIDAWVEETLSRWEHKRKEGA